MAAKAVQALADGKGPYGVRIAQDTPESQRRKAAQDRQAVAWQGKNTEVATPLSMSGIDQDAFVMALA